MKKVSIINKLTDEQLFCITLISKLNEELVEAKIITPMQRSQITHYIVKQREK